MRKSLLVLTILLALVASFIFYTFYTTGYFREVLSKSEVGQVYQSIDLPGVEDIAIAREDSFLLLSVDDRASHRAGKEGPHGIYLVDLRSEQFEAVAISAELNFPFYPHGISVLKLDSATYGLLAINHVNDRHSIESFLLKGKALQHLKTITGPELISPNDLVMVGPESFYFTNDHGYTSKWGLMAENYLAVNAASVGFFDGKKFQLVAENLSFPNGIQVDAKRNLLYVSSSRGFSIGVYTISPDGRLSFIEDISAGTGVDNIELDEDGMLWIGCHPNLLTFAAYASGKKPISPSEVITLSFPKEGEAAVRSVWTDPGTQLSGASVAVPFGNYLFIGNVMDSKVLVLKKN
jgi:arylesterase/paraoxonase